MGTLTLANFRAELLFDLKNRSDTLDPLGLSTARQNTYINAGYLWLTRPEVHRFREMLVTYTITLANGTNAYTFTPTGGLTAMEITMIRSISHVAAATDDASASRTKLFPRDEQWFQSRSHNSGAPRDYFVRGSQIIVSPTPGATEAGQVLSVAAYRQPALLSADGDVTVIQTLWDEVVVLAARWRAELHLGYRDLAEATKLDVVSLMNEYKDFEQLHAEDWDWAVEVRTESNMESA